MKRTVAGPSLRSLLRDGLQPVADAVPRLDEGVFCRPAVDLVAQPPNEDVDRAVAVSLAPAPDLLQELVSGHDAAAVERELVQQSELGGRQAGALAVHERLRLARVDPQLLDVDR